MPWDCSSMPEVGEHLGTSVRCRELLALRVMMWVVSAALLIVALSLFYVVFNKSRRSNSQAWTTSLTRSLSSFGIESVQKDVSEESMFRRASSLSNILLFGSSAKSVTTVATHDYFAPLPMRRGSSASSAFEGRSMTSTSLPSPLAPSPSYNYIVQYRQDYLKDSRSVDLDSAHEK